MRFLVIFTVLVCLSPGAWAQTTEAPTVAPVSPPTVILEAKLVQIVLNDEHRQGVDWEAIVSDFHTLQLKKEGNPIWADKKYRFSAGEISNEDCIVLLDALDTVGHLTQENFPLILLKKNELKTEDVTVDPKFLPTILLDLKWYDSMMGKAKLKIEPVIGVTLKDSSQPNTVVTLRGQTEMDLVDNNTVVIGGLIREEEITKMHKFPLLGDLPLVGLVFRKQGKLMQRTETIIFLTIHTGNFPITGEDQKL